MFSLFFENKHGFSEVFKKIGKGFNNRSCYFVVILVTIGILISISGCSSTGNAPVDNRSSAQKSSEQGFKRSHRPLYYKVKKGDTLYSISWQYGLDYKQLASWNNIKTPYIISIGKKLRLATKAKGKTKSGRKYRKKDNKPTVKLKKTKKRSTQKKTKTVKPSKKSSKKQKSTKKVNTVKPKKKRSGLNWIWPVKGKVIQKFSPSKGKKGIDIAAKQGTKVKASEAGKIVYRGHGLTGYGLLLIIKHNKEFLSAYAHNSKLIVKDGEVVKKGQIIAYTGKTATDRVKLHFEIRKNGQPVNPVKYLP